jgi:hypothetical protein
LKTRRPGSLNVGAGACPGASRVGTVEGVTFSPAHVCVAVQASVKLTASTQTAFCQFLIVLSFLNSKLLARVNAFPSELSSPPQPRVELSSG